jgi:hypothetical protein
MKTLLRLTLALSALASPALTFAQTTPAPLTRAQVVAEATVTAEDAQANGQPMQDAVGGTSATGSSASGTRVDATKPAPCTGPASFCNTFWGS